MQTTPVARTSLGQEGDNNGAEGERVKKGEVRTLKEQTQVEQE